MLIYGALIARSVVHSIVFQHYFLCYSATSTFHIALTVSHAPLDVPPSEPFDPTTLSIGDAPHHPSSGPPTYPPPRFLCFDFPPTSGSTRPRRRGRAPTVVKKTGSS